MKHRSLAVLSALAMLAALIPATALAAGEGITINEIRIDQPSGDVDEYFELAGDADASLDGLSYLVIGDGTGGSGVIEHITDLSGQTLNSNGFFVAAESSFTLGDADLVTSLNFENSDNVTHLLVRDFTGADGDDLDTDDDGTLDTTPWTEVVDLIALVEEENPPSGTEYHYGPPSIGPDGTFVPGHIYDCEDGWRIGGFDVGTDDTPGLTNDCDASPPDPEPGLVGINEIRVDQSGSDTDEYFELTGEAGTSLDGLTYLVIGDGTGGSGVIEEVTDLTGQSLDSNGFFVAAESSFTLGDADLVTSLNFENGDNVTHLLVEGFTGETGDDLDTDDDGALDLTPWNAVADSVALVQSTASGNEVYSETSVGPDGTFLPAHVYVCSDGGWTIGSFSSLDDDTPGQVNICDAPPPPPPPDPLELDINEVQGPGDVSPVEGDLVTVEGVVVGDYQGDGEDQLGGFNLQEETADQDGDPATSEGIFVFAPFADDVVVGDVVSVTGTVDEFNGMTEITDVTEVTVTGSAPDEVTAVEVSLPVTDPSDWEPYEGMLVTFPQDLYISEFFNFDRFGEIVLTTDRQYQGTHVTQPGPAANAVTEANELARITLDDTRDHQNPETVIHPDGQPFTLEHTFRGGDILQDTTGTMHFGAGSYRIQPVYLDQVEGVDGPVVTYINDNPRPGSPDPIDGDIRVASFNVLNFFTHLDDGPDVCGPTGNLDCRGADNEEEYQRQLDKLIAGIRALDADIVGIQEIENDIRTDDGDRAHHPVLTLVEELNAAEGEEVWAWGGDAGYYNDYPVRNEIIYRTDSVEPVGDPVALAHDAFDRTRPGNIEPVGRPPLAQTFRQDVNRGSSQPFTIVVNHFKSKGSSCASIGDPDTGDGQANCNLTRVAQSEALLNFVDELSEDSSGVLVVGDLNSYAMEDPITTLEDGGLTDLIEEFIGPDAYSYVFDGQLGYLDTALATRSMLNWVTGTTIFHINADEPDILDYDTTFKSETQDDLYEPEAYRVSDHDPVIVGLTFGGPGERGEDPSPPGGGQGH